MRAAQHDPTLATATGNTAALVLGMLRVLLVALGLSAAFGPSLNAGSKRKYQADQQPNGAQVDAGAPEEE